MKRFVPHLCFLFFLCIVGTQLVVSIQTQELFRSQNPSLKGTLILEDNDNYAWLLNTVEKSRHITWDGGKDGRNTYWSSGLPTVFKLLGVDNITQIENIVPIVYTGIFIALAFITLLILIHLFGSQWGSLCFLFIIFNPIIWAFWSPYRIDHHGIIAFLTCWLLASALTKNPNGVIMGIASGLLLWVSAINSIIVHFVLFLPLISLEGYRRFANLPSLLPTKTYLQWSSISAFICLLGYLLEYSSLPLRFEVANPFYSLLLLFGGLLFYAIAAEGKWTMIRSSLIFGSLLSGVVVGSYAIYSEKIYLTNIYITRILHLISESQPINLSADLFIWPAILILAAFLYKFRKTGHYTLQLLILILAFILCFEGVRNAYIFVIASAICIVAYSKFTTYTRCAFLCIGIALGLVGIGQSIKTGKTTSVSYEKQTLRSISEYLLSTGSSGIILAEPQIAVPLAYYTGLPVFNGIYWESFKNIELGSKILTSSPADVARFMESEDIGTIVLPTRNLWSRYIAHGQSGFLIAQDFLDLARNDNLPDNFIRQKFGEFLIITTK